MPIWKNTVTTKLKTSMSICKNYFGHWNFIKHHIPKLLSLFHYMIDNTVHPLPQILVYDQPYQDKVLSCNPLWLKGE